MTVRVRIAPSPTGDPHVGTAFMALFNWIYARHHNGKFILRIEDTDRTRSRTEYETNIYEALKWCGIEWDEGPDVGGEFAPYRQSERSDIYRKYVNHLLEEGKAYKCFCTAEDLAEMRELAKAQGTRLGYDRRHRNLSEGEITAFEAEGRSYVIRMKTPLKGECVIEDEVRGKIVTPWADVDDQILLKSDGFPTYHLANVVDDHLMQITHVIRGDEWISSAPKHIYLYEAFGWQPPKFVHMPLLLGTDGKKLSKRRNPTSIFYYRDSGFLPEAFINFLTLMGYSMEGDKEIYSTDEIVNEFDAKRIGVSGAIFDVNKLEWLNQHYIMNTVAETDLWNQLSKWAFNPDFMAKLMPLVHTRIKTFPNFFELCDFFFISNLNYTTELFKIKGLQEGEGAFILQTILWELEKTDDWSSENIESISKKMAEDFNVNHKKTIMPLLFAALMGKLKGPPLFGSFPLIGKDRARVRFLQAIEFMGGVSNKKIAELKKRWDNGELAGILAKHAS